VSEEVTTTTTVIAKEVMDPETETDTLPVQEEDIIPTVNPRTRRTTATDVDAMIVIDPVDMMTRTGRGVGGIVMRDQGVGHPKPSGRGRGMGWQDQTDRGRGNVSGKAGIDGLHHLVDASCTPIPVWVCPMHSCL
jgi:hypothetical protein